MAPILTVFDRLPEKQAPGYYFVSPYQQIQESVHIYDNDAVSILTLHIVASLTSSRTWYTAASGVPGLASLMHLKHACTKTKSICASTKAPR